MPGHDVTDRATRVLPPDADGPDGSAGHCALEIRRHEIADDLPLRQHPDNPILIIDHRERGDPRPHHLSGRLAERRIGARDVRTLVHHFPDSQLRGERVFPPLGQCNERVRGWLREDSVHLVSGGQESRECADHLQIPRGIPWGRHDQQEHARTLRFSVRELATDGAEGRPERDAQIGGGIRPIVQ